MESTSPSDSITETSGVAVNVSLPSSPSKIPPQQLHHTSTSPNSAVFSKRQRRLNKPTKKAPPASIPFPNPSTWVESFNNTFENGSWEDPSPSPHFQNHNLRSSITSFKIETSTRDSANVQTDTISLDSPCRAEENISRTMTHINATLVFNHSFLAVYITVSNSTRTVQYIGSAPSTPQVNSSATTTRTKESISSGKKNY